jgi:hypothetical protein
VVQLFLPGLHVVAGLTAARWRGTAAAVMFGSSVDVPDLRKLRLGHVQLGAIRRFADAVVVLNEEMRRDFIEEGVTAERITWLPCSVDTETYCIPSTAVRAARRESLQLPQDAFVVAFRIPNLLRRLFAEGAFSQAFVPVLGEYRTRRGDEATRELAGNVLGVLASVLFVATVIGVIAAPAIVYAMASAVERKRSCSRSSQSSSTLPLGGGRRPS